MGVLVSIGTTILGMYLIPMFFKKEKPLSKSDFRICCIITFILFAAVTYGFHQLVFENRWDYHNYKEVNSYIHSLNNKEKDSFQKALISQKANLDKKYGVGRDVPIDKYDSAEDISMKNSDRFGVYANPLNVEEYFDDDAYYYFDHIYYFHGVVYAGAMYYLYRRRKVGQQFKDGH